VMLLGVWPDRAGQPLDRGIGEGHNSAVYGNQPGHAYPCRSLRVNVLIIAMTPYCCAT
jgi:hypothetical protein